MRKRTSVFTSVLKCSECGTTFDIPRRKSKKRETGHIKTMYCWKCKCERDFVEND